MVHTHLSLTHHHEQLLKWLKRPKLGNFISTGRCCLSLKGRTYFCESLAIVKDGSLMQESWPDLAGKKT
jgi:hypothetical protein